MKDPEVDQFHQLIKNINFIVILKKLKDQILNTVLIKQLKFKNLKKILILFIKVN